MAIARASLTLEEFLELPEEEPPLEYANGVITQKVSPKTRHSRLQGELLKRIDGHAEPRRLAMAFPELRVTFAGRSRVPDLAVFTWSRIPSNESGSFRDEVFEPPDLVFEICSPEQSRIVLEQKCSWYVGNGVRVAALIDPDARTVVLLRSNAEAQTLTGADRIDLDDVLQGFELTVDDLFSALRAPSKS